MKYLSVRMVSAMMMSIVMMSVVMVSVMMIVCAFSSCGTGHPEAVVPANKEDGVRESKGVAPKEGLAAEERVDDILVDKIATIDFKIKAKGEEVKTFEDGFVPWVNLDSPGTRMKDLVDPDEIVLPYQKVVLVIDYPVAKPVFFTLVGSGNGFSRKQMILAISRKYHEMYAGEERTAKMKTVPIDQRKGLINRNQTDGRYGICCHDLSDLELGSVDVYKNADGVISLSLDIES